MAKKKENTALVRTVPQASSYQDIKEFNRELNDLEKKKQEVFDKATKSDDPDVIVKASNIWGQPTNSYSNQPTGLQIKSMLVDPFEFMQSFGYKEKPMRMSYLMLKRMSTAPFTASTIRTRVAQIQKFTSIPEDEYSVGFKIRLKDHEKKPKKEQLKVAAGLAEFLQHGGDGGWKWARDDFKTFITKLVRDSLTYDQYTFEVAENRKGLPSEFFATDASTFRVAFPQESRVDIKPDPLTGEKCKPKFVQIYNSMIENEFYPWELCFGVRNPRTDLLVSGYGYAELEELVTVITSLLWSEEYNRKFFSQGSAPKGIIKISGNVPPDKLQEFKREWMMQMAGVYNSWKTPIMQADKMDWVDLTKSNKDMEYSQWQEFLMKLHSAVFLIDPSEMGFDINRSANSSTMFESNNEQRIKYSRDKGLVPILRNIEDNINRYLISRLNPEYEFKFVGADAVTEDTALDRAIKELGNFKTLDEVRSKFNLKPLGDEMGGNLVLNSTWMSWFNNKLLSEQGQQGTMGEPDFGEEESDYDPLQEEAEDQNDFGKSIDNPFVADLDNFVKSLK